MPPLTQAPIVLSRSPVSYGGGVLRLGAGARAAPGRDSLTSRRPSELRDMPARPPVEWAFAGVQHFLESVHNIPSLAFMKVKQP